jgi:HEAT repeat protein
MSGIFAPTAPRLQALAAADWPQSHEEMAAMVPDLIAFMADDEVANRDWATFILAQSEADGDDVRAALVKAAQDAELSVRGEAVLGLARRDRSLALPLVQAGLAGETVSVAMLEAAEICAHPSLIPDLEVWARPSSNRLADMAATEALIACKQRL